MLGVDFMKPKPCNPSAKRLKSGKPAESLVHSDPTGSAPNAKTPHTWIAKRSENPRIPQRLRTLESYVAFCPRAKCQSAPLCKKVNRYAKLAKPKHF